MARSETRKERYAKKTLDAKVWPIEVATVSLQCDDNIAYIARAAACFSCSKVHVIGKLPAKVELKRLSAGNSELVEFVKHSDPIEFIKYCKDNGYVLVSFELEYDTLPLNKFQFAPNAKYMLFFGHETLGCPVDVVKASVATIAIPMLGRGYSLNVSQTANIALFEYMRQMLTQGIEPDRLVVRED